MTNNGVVMWILSGFVCFFLNLQEYFNNGIVFRFHYNANHKHNEKVKRPPFGKELPTRLTIFSLCILTICNFSYFPFWF